MDNSGGKHYPVLDRISRLVNDSKPVNESIDGILCELGEKYRLIYIAVKEVSQDDHVVICTYEWSKDGTRELVHCESRYIDSIPWESWMSAYDNDLHIWTWSSNSGAACPVRIIRTDVAAAILQVPIYRNGEFSGCVDFVDDKPDREWKPGEISELKQFVTILGKYLFKIREIADTSVDFMTELYDRTTRLPKYEYFCKEIENNLGQLNTCQLVILSIDFTNFKFINEKYGHQEGNYFLETIARDIYKRSKWVISCCRSHSDNFLVLSKCDKMYTKTRIRISIETFAEAEEKKLAERYFDCNIRINMGIHIIRSGDENIEQAISNANLARKFAKQEKFLSGHTCLLYEPMMAYRLKQDADYISTMSKGIDNGEFFIEYQPMTRTDSLEIVGCEAVVRWRREQIYKLMPEDFVPIFEKDGCIVKMDYFVYEQIFKKLHERISQGLNTVPVSLNVNIVHFYEDKLVPFIDMLMEKYPIPAGLISFEMDEKVFAKNPSSVADFITRMHERGYSVFIDNFGNGYSSLNILTGFDIDGIKIDRSFIRGGMERADEIIISSVVDMASKLGLKVVTEGVENEEQRQFLIDVKCPFIQGNYYSGPVSEEKFSLMLG